MHHRTPITLILGAGLMFAGLTALLATDSTNTPPTPAGRLATLPVRVTGFRNDQGIRPTHDRIRFTRQLLGLTSQTQCETPRG